MVQDLDPLISTLSTLYPTLNKDKWLISSGILPCLAPLPLLYHIWEEEWMGWDLYPTLPSTPKVSPEKSTIYHIHLGYGRNSGWYENYIQLSLHHQL